MNNISLKDVTQIKGGSGFPELYQGQKSGDYPFIKVSDMNLKINKRYIIEANNHVNKDTVRKLSLSVFSKDTLVFAKVGAAVYLNKRRVLTKDTIIDNNMMGVTPIGIDADFLFQLMLDIDLGELVQPGALPSVNQEIVGAIKIPYFSKFKQQKIAKILSTVDNLIEQTQALIDKYTAIKQGMMTDLFTRGIDLSGTPETNPNHGQLRHSFEEAPELYKETELGWIPKGWEALNIEDVATKVTDGDHHTPLRSDEGVLLLSARNIHNGYLDLGNVDYVPRFEYDRMINRCHPEPGDILISCSGTIGRVCEVPKDIIFSLVRSVALVKLDLEKISSRYMEWFLKDEKSRKAMFDSSLQAAQPNLFQAAIKSLPLLLPELNEQREIAKRLDGFESLINLERASMNQRKEIKKGLMQDLLTGKVRVNA